MHLTSQADKNPTEVNPKNIQSTHGACLLDDRYSLDNSRRRGTIRRQIFDHGAVDALELA